MSAPPAHGHGKPGEMHLPHGSVWPFWLSLAIALLGCGIIALGQSLQLHDPYAPHAPSLLSLVLLGAGVAAVGGALAGWFVEDYRWWNSLTGTGTHIPKAGALLFISSEVFLFGALFTNYYTFQSLNPGNWPDTPVHLPLLKTGIFTLFLFASSATIHMAEHHLKRGHHRQFVNWWGLTILLGLVFLGGQVWEYANLIHEGHTLGSGQFITAFYILTGAHGLHVFGGLCLLTVMWLRARKGQFTAERHAGPQVASMYWHFVDIVWVFVFGLVYVTEAFL
ncbi:MAG TPA: cytochrome c oxidase subunit 3 [Candidatus Thermoplasmatota archaeon]|nr:cytochrome c oxidase subunit 3 [Candidatus Thermoplasmatota archaeon]